jgi:putative ABC transport system ATP-binding protein
MFKNNVPDFGEPVLRVAGLEQCLHDPNSGDHFRVVVPAFALRESEWIALAGPTGCGKSTLLYALGLLRRPTRVDEFVITDLGAGGPVHYDARRLWEQGRQGAIEALRRRTLGFAPQRPELIPSLTAAENVEVPLRLNLAPDAGGRVRELLLALSLPDARGTPDLVRVAHNRPYRLSGGQAQRINLARAVAHRPRLLLADEPTSSLDPKTAEHVLTVLDKLRRDEGTAVVLVTHDEALVGRFADRVVRMDVLADRLGGIAAAPAALARALPAAAAVTADGRG